MGVSKSKDFKMFKANTLFLFTDANNDTFTKTIFNYIVRGHSTLHLKYTKEILKNTKENIGQRDFSVFDPLTYFYR